MSSISQALAKGTRRCYSFEFFPPASVAAEEQLWAAITQLILMKPDFISVTYGANGSSRDRTISITRRIVSETKIPTMAHLTCVGQTTKELIQAIEAYSAAGVCHVLAIRGDMPGGPTVPWQQYPGGLKNATELVRLVKQVNSEMTVGVAAFPDLHPQSRNADLDAQILVEKAEAGAEFAITQMFFVAARYFELTERIQKLGGELPIIPGIQPVTTLTQIERFAQLSGAELPNQLVSALRATKTPDELRQVGSQAASQLAMVLLKNGAPGLHFFTLNRSLATREIFARLQENGV